MTYVTAIVLAAGKGLRLSSKLSKPLVKLKNKPLIIYPLDILNRHHGIKNIVLVANPQNLKNIIQEIKKYRIAKVKSVVLGGSRRQDSVRRGLKAVNKDADLILIHDGVRPFINKQTVSCVIREAKRCGAAIVGVPVKATIKSVKVSPPQRLAGPPSIMAEKCQSVKDKFVVEKTLNREKLWEIQTPQVFKRDLIFRAYEKFGKIPVSDDAMLVEKLGVKVSVVLGSYHNIKITTPEDLVLAEAILRSYKL